MFLGLGSNKIVPLYQEIQELKWYEHVGPQMVLFFWLEKAVLGIWQQ